jgi:folylpolyglutamate synthase
MTSTAGRTYADALALLESLQSNRAIVSSISDASHDRNLDAIPEMLDWTRKAGYDVNDFAKRGLKCIHVAGTKGKGSVCVMIENILLQYRKGIMDGLGEEEAVSLGKIGLYTSPHLVTVRERIRIDGVPISESLFTRYFFELWDRFTSAATSVPSDVDPSSSDTKPGYFRYLTLLAFHTFVEEGVESAVIECGIGGEYDSTNILPPEAVSVSAIAKLGIDHVGMLGNTIESIAWHKGGIIKHGVPAYTVDQVPRAQAVLERCAADKGSELIVVGRLPALKSADFKLGLGGDFQKDNASLAIAVATSHLQTIGPTALIPTLSQLLESEPLSSQFLKGLETASWPGRWETRIEGNIEWLIDGAHTTDSLEATANWYLEKLTEALNDENPPTSTMLIFNQQDRDAKALMRRFISALDRNTPSLKFGYSRMQTVRLSFRQKLFTFAAFCTNIPFKDMVPADVDLVSQKEVAKVYETMSANTLHMSFGSIEEAVELARKISQGDERVLVLVTGSLHLVGGLMKVLDRGLMIEATSSHISQPIAAPQPLEHAKEDEDSRDHVLPDAPFMESNLEQLIGSDPGEAERAREEIFEAFLSTISPENRANIMGEDLIEPPAPPTSRSVHYFHAKPQPYHSAPSDSQLPEPSHPKRTKRVKRASRSDIEAFFANSKVGSRDDSLGRNEPSASEPGADHSKSNTKP